MKKNTILILLVALILIVVIAVAGFFWLQKDISDARQIALQTAKDSSAQIIEEKTEKDFLITEYEFSLLADEYRYEVTVDSFGNVTGFEKEKIPALNSTQNSSQTNSETNTMTSSSDIGLEKAQQIALSHHSDGVITKSDRDMEHTGLVYEIEVTEGSIEYDYVIDGANGDILHTSKEFRD